jgi:hypothetical protein
MAVKRKRKAGVGASRPKRTAMALPAGMGLGAYLESRVQVIQGQRCFLDVDLAVFWGISLVAFHRATGASANFYCCHSFKAPCTRHCERRRLLSSTQASPRFGYTADAMRTILRCLPEQDSTAEMMTELLRDILRIGSPRSNVGSKLRGATRLMRRQAEHADAHGGDLPVQTSELYLGLMKDISEGSEDRSSAMVPVLRALHHQAHWQREYQDEARELSERLMPSQSLALERENAKRAADRALVFAQTFMAIRPVAVEASRIVAAFEAARDAWPDNNAYKAPVNHLLGLLGVKQVNENSLQKARSKIRDGVPV